MRRIGITIAALALCGSVAFSQGMIEALKLGQTELQGTARYMGMSGAFGALGGDISAMSSNPAGLAVYRTSEVVTTLNLSHTNAKTDWLGNTMDNGRTKFNFDNIAYVGYFPTGNDVGLVSWNAGFAYNRLKNFNRHYYMKSGSGLDTSLSDYMATRAYGISSSLIGGKSAYDDLSDWLSVLGYQAGIIDHDGDNVYVSPFGDWDSNGNWNPYGLDEARLNVRESGGIDQYDIAFGLNFSDIFLFGATFTITDINYELSSSYYEFFTTDKNDFYLDNGLITDGSGYGFNVGAIVRPVDFLRFGFAYNSPTWYNMTDSYLGEAGSSLLNSDYPEGDAISDNSPKGAYTDYKYRAPDKFLISAAAIIGTYGLISVDYEMTNYKNMQMSDHRGNVTDYYYDVNNDIDINLRNTSTVRIGAEARVTPQFSVRAGGSFTSSAMKDPMKNGEREVFTVGTLPHYTIDKGKSSFSVGLGYRFTPQFYTDIACVFSTYKEDAYAFSSIIEDGRYLISAQPASLKTNRTQASLTVGYKF